MNFVISILVGGVFGWIVSLFWGTSERQVIILNVVVGVFGVVLASWMLDSLLELSTFNQVEFGIAGLLVSLLAALVLLAAVKILGGITGRPAQTAPRRNLATY